MKKMKTIDRKLFNLPAAGGRKAFKLPDPADAPCDASEGPSTTAHLVVSHVFIFFAGSLMWSLYMKVRLFPKCSYPTFNMNLIISTCT